MFADGPLLVAQQGQDGAFPHWLEELGLKDFLSSYPLRQLVEWGWLIPQYRIVFSQEFFISWEHFPMSGVGGLPESRSHSLLWESEWFIDTTDEPLWFLHPFFRPGDPIERLLDQQGKAMPGIPEEFPHPNGSRVTPYADYFYHWQGYALVDVIRSADHFPGMLNTPDAKERAERMVETAKRLKEWKWDPRDVLTVERRWGGLAQPMTWLSHYRSFRDALWFFEHDRPNDRTMRQNGAQLLAGHLGVSADALTSAIKDRFLVLAQDWSGASERHSGWIFGAWPYLQREIWIAVEWLCYLTNKTFDNFLEEWRYRDYLGGRIWAELKKVLPYEFFEDRETFIQLAPDYLKTYNSLLPDSEQLRGKTLATLVDRLRATNYPFGSFLGAFRQLHDELAYRYDKRGALDFRELRPLDYYSLLAIRAEGAFRYALDQNTEASAKKPDNLRDYIAHFAGKRGLPNRAIDYFCQKDRSLTRLYDTPPDPISTIINLTPGFGSVEDYLVKAFLCCSLARNYFAHHHYLDRELLRSEKSGFMLGGILATVLNLLRL